MLKLRKNSDAVFANTFKRYSKKEILEFVDPFKIRFKKNKINPKKLFKGKKVLDFGCGNGRGALFMALNGAKNLHGLDISKINTLTTKENLKKFNYKIKVVNSPAEKSLFKDNSFDFVWCNGVIMHTETPSKVLSEIFRVLKPGGQSWIYVYGSNGLWWSVINELRKQLKTYKEKKIINCLINFGYKNRYIAEYLDDWKVLNLRTYKARDFENSLKRLGAIKIKKCERGLDYDTSEKLFITKDKAIYGEGDLRYLIKKKKIKNFTKKNSTKNNKNLNFNHYLKHNISQIYIKTIKSIFLKTKNSALKKIHLSAKIQFKLRGLLNRKKFDKEKFLEYLKKLNNDKSLK